MQAGMGVPLEELPLFLLGTVLFPYSQARLHVFEDRYREMVQDCLQEDKQFGIVLIRSGSEVGGPAEPYLVGTSVRITKVHTFDDGRMDIQVYGERRFRIRRLDESKPYLTGFVEPVAELDATISPRADALVIRAREDFQMWVQRVMARPDFQVQVRFPDDIVALSFAIANTLPIENIEKQRLLEQTDTLERIADLIPMLETQIMEAQPPDMHRVKPEELQDWVFKN